MKKSKIVCPDGRALVKWYRDLKDDTLMTVLQGKYGIKYEEALKLSPEAEFWKLG